MTLARTLCIIALFIVTGCVSPSDQANNDAPSSQGDFGVLLMAHGGIPDWEEAVLKAVKPLQSDTTIEVAFGMADAVSLQKAVTRLEAQGVRKIAVVRLFISGESWFERTEQILGIREGAPARPTTDGHAQHDHGGHGGHGGHSMEFWRIKTVSSFVLSTEGLAEARAMGDILADRAKFLSSNPKNEDVLILAHGPGNDAENTRWIANIANRTAEVKNSRPFRRVQVMTLREDWPEKRKAAEARIRNFVTNAGESGGKAIVIPFRVQGFGPYAGVLEGLQYASNGQGLIPHPLVTQWISQQVDLLRNRPFAPSVGS